jgi:hypothetical protein
LGLAIALASPAGCDRSTEASRALIVERQASWTREIGAMRQQHAALAARIGQRETEGGDGPAEQRTLAVLEGARQSIADVESQLAQATPRLEAAATGGGEAGQRAIDEESARARAYLQALGEQLRTAGRQIDDFGRNQNGVGQR